MSRGRIPQHEIDAILAKVNIVDVIGNHVALKPAGKDFKGLCPFHNEKTPSFSVSGPKGFYHCFGCGQSGTALTFLMEHGGMAFREALTALCNQAGVPAPKNLPAEGNGNVAPVADSREMLDKAQALFRQNLEDESVGAEARTYLESIGISPETADKYGVGYARAEKVHLAGALSRSEEARTILADIGLVVRHNDTSPYDFFQHRLMFPITEMNGRITGFGGRALAESRAKYLNSRQSYLFEKGSSIFGIAQARNAAIRSHQVIVVEGYTDVLALSQAGFDNAVACLGTAVTASHARTLYRIADEVIVCMDGDTAGLNAALRTLDVMLPMLSDGSMLSFIHLDNGMDPADGIRKYGADFMKSRIAERIPFEKIIFSKTACGLPPQAVRHSNRCDLMARAFDAAAERVLMIPEGTLRELLLIKLARWLEIDLDIIRRLISDLKARSVRT